jgi:hypothetical protein
LQLGLLEGTQKVGLIFDGIGGMHQASTISVPIIVVLVVAYPLVIITIFTNILKTSKKQPNLMRALHKMLGLGVHPNHASSRVCCMTRLGYWSWSKIVFNSTPA